MSRTEPGHETHGPHIETFRYITWSSEWRVKSKNMALKFDDRSAAKQIARKSIPGFHQVGQGKGAEVQVSHKICNY